VASRAILTAFSTAKAMPYKKGFGPFAGEIYRMPMSYPFRDVDGMTGKDAAARAISMIEKQVGADECAAVLIEPVQGEGGFIVPADGFLPALSEWCSANGVVFIADEIQSGFCRTGSWFACDDEGVVPDLITSAKGIAAGMPLAAVTGRAALMDAVHPGGLGGTYGGNPIACAAALATIDTMQELDLNAAARRIEALVLSRMQALAASTGRIGDVRGRGAMLALEFTVAGSLEPDQAAATAVAKACHAQGVVILTCGTYGNVIRLLPPLVIGEELLSEGLDVLEAAVRAL
jgi:4-aminobutyrate aminotransferase/(S)-3-amino-2-methylpropionate transaminase